LFCRALQILTQTFHFRIFILVFLLHLDISTSVSAACAA
jgi:hypothetical protein